MAGRRMTGIDRELMAQQDPQACAVEIYDQIYHLRGTDRVYIERLAEHVDAKMRAVAAHGGTVDSLRVAVLAALNIADELMVLRERYEAMLAAERAAQQPTAISIRSRSLMGMLDDVLEERKAS